MPPYKPKPALVLLGWLQANEEAGSHALGFTDRPLTQADWDEYISTCSIAPQLRPRVIDFVSVEREADTLVGSPAAYCRELAEIQHPMLIGGRQVIAGLALVQTAVTNYLSAVSAFIYRAERYLSRTFGGKQSGQFQAFRAACRAEFDAHFAYRLFRSMRNFSQHEDSPVSIINMNASADDQGKLVFTVKSVGIDRQKLLKSLIEEGTQPTFRKELADLPDEIFDLAALVPEDLRAIGRLFQCLCSFHSEELTRMTEYATALRGLMAHKGFPGATPVLFGGAPNPGQTLKPHQFGFDELDFLLAILARTTPA